MPKFSMSDLGSKYNNFFAPKYKITVDGKELNEKSVKVMNILVELSVGAIADAVAIEIGDSYSIKDKKFVLFDSVKVGKNIEVELGYGKSTTKIFEGVITMVECSFSVEDTNSFVVKGMSKEFLMMRGKKSKTWKKAKHSAIISEIGKKYFSKVDVDDTGVVYDIVEQYEESDFNFVKALALKSNCEFYIEKNSLYFKKSLNKKDPIVKFKIGEKQLFSISVEADISKQVEKVIVRGHDKKEFNKIVVGKADSVKKIGKGSKTGVDFIKSLASEVTTLYLYKNVQSETDAKNKAQAILDSYSMELVKGSGKCIGIPEIVAGQYIEIEGLGGSLDNTYYITAVSHSLSNKGYEMIFKIGGNAI